MSNTIQNAKKTTALDPKTTAKKTLTSLIKSMEGEIARALPSVITPERFTRMVLSAVSTTPKLAECTSNSFLAAMMSAAQLGLEPNTVLGYAYLIPYGNKVQFQLGYRGLLELAKRSEQITQIYTHTVYSNDEFSYRFGLDPDLKHVPAKGDRGEPVYYYAVFKTKNGGEGFDVMSIEDVTRHAKKYSKSFNDGPWKTNFNEMAEKTILKRLLKYAPMSSDAARAVSQDETIKSEIDVDMSIIPDETPIDGEFTEVNTNTGEVTQTEAE